MKTALVIGGTGLLGRGVADELQTVGWKVSILSRGHKELPKSLAACELITADHREPGALGEAVADRSFDLVVDCAAYNRIDAEEAVKAFTGKVGHYWFISSDFVYAAEPSARFPIKEDAPTQTDTSYAADKLEAEATLLQAAENKAFPVTILRPPHILGPGRPAGCDPAAGGRDDTLCDRLRQGESLPLLAGGLFLIQPIWSREIGRCVHQLFQQSNTLGQRFNIAGSECVTILEYYRMVADLCGTEFTSTDITVDQFLESAPNNRHVARHRIYDTSALMRAGFTPGLSLKAALQETLNL